jgi:WD40 repeat protein
MQRMAQIALLLLILFLATCGPPGEPTAPPTGTVVRPSPLAMGETTKTVATATHTPEPTTPPTASPVPPTVTLAPTDAPTASPPAPQAITPENASQVVLLAQLGQGSLGSMALLPEGQRIAAAYQTGYYLYDAPNLEQLAFLPAESSKAGLVAHPDGRHLIATGEEGLQIWDVERGHVVYTLEDGGRLVSLDREGAIMATIATELVEGVYHDYVALWDLSTLGGGEGTEIRRLLRVDGIPGGVSAVALSPDGDILITSGGQDYDDPDDRPLRLWDTASGQPLAVPGDLAGAPAYLKNLRVSHDGRLLVASDISEIYVWDLATGKTLYVLGSQQGNVSALAFSLDDRYLASGTGDGDVYIWDLGDGALVNVPLRHSAELLDLAFLPLAAADGGQMLVTATARDGVQVLDLSHAEVVSSAAPQGPTEEVTALAYNPAGTLLAAASTDETIWLWDVATGDPVRRLAAPNLESSSWCACYWSLAFSPDGATLASGSTDGAVRLWDTGNGNLLDVWEAPAGLVYGLGYSPDGRFLAGGDAQGNLLIWDLDRGLTAIPALTLDNPPTALSISFGPDGKTLATGSGFGVIRIWDIGSGEVLGEMQASTNSVRALFHPDGNLLASGSSGFGPDYAVRLWDPASGELLRTLEGHTRDVKDLAFSPDGCILATCDGDGVTRLWDAATGQPLRVLEQAWPVDSVAFGATGKQFATAGFDGLVRIWGIP